MNYQSKLPKGIYTATLTPLNSDLSVNYNLLIKHMEWLLDQGSTGIVLMGTTGEANSFTVSERIEVLDKVIEAGIDPTRLLIGTGTCTIQDTIELTAHAVGNGVGGSLMLPPFFYKDLNDEGILEYFRHVIEGVDNEELRIYLYHFPKMTGVPFNLELLEKLLDAFPDEIVGMKDSSGDLTEMQKVCESLPGFQLYAGSEKFLLNNLRCGGPGCISATFNASIKYGAAVYRHWMADNADQLQEELTNLRSRFEVTSFVSGLKYLFANWTQNDKWLNMRPPNSLPDINTQETLLSNFDHTKLL